MALEPQRRLTLVAVLAGLALGGGIILALRRPEKPKPIPVAAPPPPPPAPEPPSGPPAPPPPLQKAQIDDVKDILDKAARPRDETGAQPR